MSTAAATVEAGPVRMATKICSKCGEDKPLDEFNLRGDAAERAAGKRRSECRTCASKRGTDYAKTTSGRAVVKASVRRYLDSAKGQATVTAYRESERGREIQHDSVRRYPQTPKGSARSPAVDHQRP